MIVVNRVSPGTSCSNTNSTSTVGAMIKRFFIAGDVDLSLQFVFVVVCSSPVLMPFLYFHFYGIPNDPSLPIRFFQSIDRVRVARTQPLSTTDPGLVPKKLYHPVPGVAHNPLKHDGEIRSGGGGAKIKSLWRGYDFAHLIMERASPWFYITSTLDGLFWPTEFGAPIDPIRHAHLLVLGIDGAFGLRLPHCPVPDHLRGFEFKFRAGGCVTLTAPAPQEVGYVITETGKLFLPARKGIVVRIRDHWWFRADAFELDDTVRDMIGAGRIRELAGFGAPPPDEGMDHFEDSVGEVDGYNGGWA